MITCLQIHNLMTNIPDQWSIEFFEGYRQMNIFHYFKEGNNYFAQTEI